MMMVNHTTNIKSSRSSGFSRSNIKAINENHHQLSVDQNILTSSLLQLYNNDNSALIINAASNQNKHHQQLSSSVANPVVIIHQNQSVSTNLQQADLSADVSRDQCFNNLLDKQQNSGKEVNEMLNELKYMKG